MADSYIQVTNRDFTEKVLNAPQMVVVAFFASWSNACEILKTEYEAVSREYRDRAIFTEINVDEAKSLVEDWNVDGVPTLIFFNGGREIHRIKGIVMRDKLRRQVAGTLLAP